MAARRGLRSITPQIRKTTEYSEYTERGFMLPVPSYTYELAAVSCV